MNLALRRMSARWGEIPEVPINTECYDELARITRQVLQSEDYFQLDRTGVEFNECLKPSKPSQAPPIRTEQFQEATSPFYEVMKLLLRDEIDLQQRTGGGENQPNKMSIDQMVGNELRDTVTLILTYAGFHHATQNVLHILTDLLERFLVTLFKNLRLEVSELDQNSQSDLMPALTKVLQKLNMPNPDALHRFEQDISDHYQQVKQSTLPSMSSS